MFGKTIKKFSVFTTNKEAMIAITKYDSGIYMINANFKQTNVGFVLCDIDRKICTIKNIYVYPDYRREGVGTQLLKVVETLARKHNCNKIIGLFSPQITENEALSFYCGLNNYKPETLNKNKSKFSIIKFKNQLLIYKKLTNTNKTLPDFINEDNIYQ